MELDVTRPAEQRDYHLMANGAEVPFEVIKSDPGNERLRIRLLAIGVPPVGYTGISWIDSASAGAHLAKQTSGVLGTETSLENNFLKLTVDPATGCITSLFDKRSNTEALAPAVPGVGAPPNLPDGKPCGNLLQAFVDKPKQWDAWNVDADFIEHHTDLLQADEVKLIENTPLRAVIRVKHTWQSSTLHPGHHALCRHAAG